MITVDDIQKEHEAWLKYCCVRYHTGVWSPDDVHQEILLKIHEAILQNKITKNSTDKLIRSFIICRAIDIVRTEKSRRAVMLKVEREWIEPTTINHDESIVEILDFIRTHLPDQQARIIIELSFPSEKTYKLAKERCKNYPATHVKHSINKRDVATSMGVSPATVSRAVQKAQDLFTDP